MTKRAPTESYVKPVPECLDHDGAQRIAGLIATYWQKQGKHVMTWIEPCGTHRGEVYVVRSSMKNGAPR